MPSVPWTEFDLASDYNFREYVMYYYVTYSNVDNYPYFKNKNILLHLQTF